MDPVTNEKFMPHVIEPAAGLSRGVLALICEAYTIDPSRPSGVYLNFHPSVAPLKAAILPLTDKDDHVPIAQKLYLELREEFAVELDIKQNIGKRYARQDEIGTPYCFTIDNDTITDVADRCPDQAEATTSDRAARARRRRHSTVTSARSAATSTWPTLPDRSAAFDASPITPSGAW
jgi:glycyl-tRNA synthetase (class II)